MRQVKKVTLLASILVLMMQCSENESLNGFNGRMEVGSAPIQTKTHILTHLEYSLPTDSIKDTIITNILYYLRTDSIKDSIRWIYEFPPGGNSRLSIIVSGQASTDSLDTNGALNPISYRLDLQVETFTDGVQGIAHLAYDSVGGFLDTVLLATSQQSELLLTQSSRIFVKSATGDTTFDTIQLINPHDAWGPR